MSRKIRKIKRREKTQNIQAITMYDQKLPSLVIIQSFAEKERETEGNILAGRTHGLFHLFNRGDKLTVVTFFGHALKDQANVNCT